MDESKIIVLCVAIIAATGGVIFGPWFIVVCAILCIIQTSVWMAKNAGLPEDQPWSERRRKGKTEF